MEAHGGYTFCGTAALVILGKEHMLDLKALLVSNSITLFKFFCRGRHDMNNLLRITADTTWLESKKKKMLSISVTTEALC